MKGSIGLVLCSLGLHAWRPWRKWYMEGKSIGYKRACHRCMKIQLRTVLEKRQ